ncbi:BPTD_3080 family restriction endonuclease [Halomicronema sp. CCY15110]|uniref:BPTD_3080 family restriction endonuclease n=1 Tax=Halomicronema sp. CCY15110 TaxID=2767773 RepID=UPI001951C9DA|nr:DEAD/DEAH box helicase family protein [Halomicronema sp. CCY15110]
MTYEVDTPILNSPFEPPTNYWFIQEGEPPQLRDGRRPSIVYPPEQTRPWDTSDDVLLPCKRLPNGHEARGFDAYYMTLVNRIRDVVDSWRSQGYPGVTRTTLELLQHWNDDERQWRLFYTQREAVETVIFLTEARADFLQGLTIPSDDPTERQWEDGIRAFKRYACKMATGSGKTTVMGMLAAWSILNKVNDRSDARFSDVVLIVCPNVTIRDRLAELNPDSGEASLYRTRDLVPSRLMDSLRRGRVLVTNWHLFERRTPQTAGDAPAKVVQVGVPVQTTEVIRIGDKNTTARGRRYLDLDTYRKQVALGQLRVAEGGEKYDTQGNLESAKVVAFRRVESETAWIQRILGREVGGKQNILVLNDEAHHAYRIPDEPLDDEQQELLAEAAEEDDDYTQREATIWVEGLDRIHKLRGINLCVDLSATPYYLTSVGYNVNMPFPWVVSDFSLMDAIESGLVKVPQLAVRDTTGTEIPGYFNIWKWIMEKMSPKERGSNKVNPRPQAVLKYAQTPISILGGEWVKMTQEWADAENGNDDRPPVFILVCKNTQIAKTIYEWLAEGKQPSNVSPNKIELFHNTPDRINTIRVDSKVSQEMEAGSSASDEAKWMRFTLDTIGKATWPTDPQKRPIYPEGFEALAEKLDRPLHPPGRDIRCIVSVGMLTEGWDCSTVTHVIGIRPFMSQLLCEQVVGRALRRRSYELQDNNQFSEEVAQVFGVPFAIVPFKANNGGGSRPTQKRHRIYAVPGKDDFQIEIPRVDGYTQAVRNRVRVDWETVPTLEINPFDIAPEVQMKATVLNNKGRPSLCGPGSLEDVNLNPYRQGRRFQELVFDLATTLTKSYMSNGRYEAPAHVLFPQLRQICDRYLRDKVKPISPAQILDVFLSPYYGWVVDHLTDAIQPDTDQGEAPEVPFYDTHRPVCSTGDIDFWTSKTVREVLNSHVNYVVADSSWESSTAYILDNHPGTATFIKNQGLGFAIPYLGKDGNTHDYIPDFIIRFKTEQPHYLILEPKGWDPNRDRKRAAAERWCDAVNADGRYGHWQYRLCQQKDAQQHMDEVWAIVRTSTSSVQPIASTR